MVLPRQSGSLAVRVGVVVGGEQLAQIDLLARRVRQLDADGVAARHHGDARRQRAHRARDVVGQPDHARRLDAGRGLELVERDHRARPRIDDLAAHAEIAEHAFERGGVVLERLGAERGAPGRLRRGQEVERRQLIAAATGAPAVAPRAACAARAARSSSSSSSSSSASSCSSVAAARPGSPRSAARRRARCGGRSRRAARRAGVRANRAREPRLQAEEAVREPAERDRARASSSSSSRGLRCVGASSFLVVGARARPMPGGDGKGDQRADAGDGADHDAGQSPARPSPASRPAAAAARRRSRRRARPAAARPACAAGRRRSSRRAARASDPEQQPQPFAARAADGWRAASPRSRSAAPARPRRGRAAASADRRRWRPATPSRLRTGALVAWLRLGSCTDQVASATRQQHREHDQREARQLAQPPAQRVAQAVGEEAQAVEAAFDRPT